jgi:hypothetical protein
MGAAAIRLDFPRLAASFRSHSTSLTDFLILSRITLKLAPFLRITIVMVCEFA